MNKNKLNKFDISVFIETEKELDIVKNILKNNEKNICIGTLLFDYNNSSNNFVFITSSFTFSYKYWTIGKGYYTVQVGICDFEKILKHEQ